MTHSTTLNNGLTTEFFNSFVNSTVKTYKQGKASMDAEGMCKYRGARQTCCIIGHSIADEHYLEQMDTDSLSSGDSVIERALELSVGTEMNEHDTRLAQLLQVLHDNLSKVTGDVFKERLLKRLEEGKIAKEYPEFVFAVKILIDKEA